MISEQALEASGWKKRQLPGFIELIGPLWTKKEADSWAYGILANDAHLNPAGVVHGGVIASLLDHALSTLAWEAMARSPCLTVQLDTQYIAPVTSGQLIEVRGTVVQKSTTMVFMRGEATCGGGLVASASAILKALSRTSKAS